MTHTSPQPVRRYWPLAVPDPHTAALRIVWWHPDAMQCTCGEPDCCHIATIRAERLQLADPGIVLRLKWRWYLAHIYRLRLDLDTDMRAA
ncbi:MAG TPA: hypothetical protein VHD87_12610 [Acidimicrobiales bacterium]|nr:hypothetical protein [Acidimicrobiales bacterium]